MLFAARTLPGILAMLAASWPLSSSSSPIARCFLRSLFDSFLRYRSSSSSSSAAVASSSLSSSSSFLSPPRACIFFCFSFSRSSFDCARRPAAEVASPRAAAMPSASFSFSLGVWNHDLGGRAAISFAYVTRFSAFVICISACRISFSMRSSLCTSIILPAMRSILSLNLATALSGTTRCKILGAPCRRSTSFSSFLLSSTKKEMARPLRPARAVRPTRCR
mmetsp:Transcript_7371/g.12724  ORF Transcript_7371/g.12724 Transcript_7371/m.12724 type:complete len:221 (+) Transcript_7371:188-850(+)